MSARTPVGPVLIFLLVLSSGAGARLLDTPADQSSPRFPPPAEVVALYKSAVTRGELVVFGKTLANSMIRPTRVEYVYDLVTDVPAVKVYAELLVPFSAPDPIDCKVYGVSALISTDGRIVDTEAHLWPE